MMTTITAQLAQARARTWNDLVVELSAETGRLAVTPAPYGKPGGPGLYHVKGLKHSDYLENIVHALMRKGMDKGKATAIARGSIRRWMVKSKHPEVRAAAAGAETQEIAAQARAHAHANTWDDLFAVIDLAFIANPTAAQWAVIDAREGRVWKPDKVKTADLVTHKDGSVTGGKGKTAVGSLTRENGGKWVAHHGDGTVTKHATKQAALSAMVTRHNKAGAVPAKTAPAAPTVPAKAVPAVKVTPQVPAAKAAPVKAAAPQAAKSDTFVKPTDLSLHDDGSVVSKKTGAEVGAVRGVPGGAFEARHADGAVTRHATPADAVKAIAGTTTASAAARKPKPGELTMADKQNLASFWSNSFRYSNQSYVHGKEGEDFTRELHRLLATNKPPKTCGKGCQKAHKFLGMVDHDATVQPKELHRGIILSTADAERMFKPGKTADMPAASWSTKPEWADSFAGKTSLSSDPGNMKVVIHTAPGAKGMDLSSASLFGEGEVVTGGRYSVDSVKTTNGVMDVYVTQQGFSAN